MRTVAVVPIKLNSDRIKNKNIREFKNGKPLCNYILQTLKNVKNIDEIYVFCSDESIKKYIPKGVTFLKRSKTLDQSTTTINEVLLSFAQKIDADYYVLSHATAPFIKNTTIEDCVDNVKSGKYDSAFTVEKIQTFLWKNGQPINYKLDKIPRTQDLEPIYAETSGVYVFKKDCIMKFNRRIGNNPYVKEISKIESIDIDIEEDFIIADAIYNFLKK